MSENFFLEGEELMALVRDRMAAGQTVRWLPFRGVSMLPMLRQGKDKVEISPLPDVLQKYDLPVYQYPSGKYVMHRIVGVKEGYFVCNGDNLLQMEQIPRDWMIGIVTAFIRNGKEIKVSDPSYRLYCRFWVASRPVRHLWRRGVNLLKRTVRRCLK